ncbi:MAG: hypothetical protein V7K92_23750 [Nostoc sp.]|uniref:hypothetical protein n=1 Tax=Nostoc sp. TaxID=1180 RepID=UPI002FF10395
MRLRKDDITILKLNKMRSLILGVVLGLSVGRSQSLNNLNTCLKSNLISQT